MQPIKDLREAQFFEAPNNTRCFARSNKDAKRCFYRLTATVPTLIPVKINPQMYHVTSSPNTSPHDIISIPARRSGRLRLNQNQNWYRIESGCIEIPTSPPRDRISSGTFLLYGIDTLGLNDIASYTLSVVFQLTYIALAIFGACVLGASA
jgi:hypothetical protein